MSASFDGLSTPLHNVKYYGALDRANFLKQIEYVNSRLGVGPKKKTSVGPKYCTRWYENDSNADMWESINQIPSSHIPAYCSRKRITISREIDRCIVDVLSVPPPKKKN